METLLAAGFGSRRHLLFWYWLIIYYLLLHSTHIAPGWNISFTLRQCFCGGNWSPIDKKRNSWPPSIAKGLFFPSRVQNKAADSLSLIVFTCGRILSFISHLAGYSDRANGVRYVLGQLWRGELKTKLSFFVLYWSQSGMFHFSWIFPCHLQLLLWAEGQNKHGRREQIKYILQSMDDARRELDAALLQAKKHCLEHGTQQVKLTR